MMEDNELRNLYRKDGIYKVYTTLKNTTHIFAVFQDLEKAILYRDLFESSNWNMDLKGITDLDNPLSSEIIIEKQESSADLIDEVEELENIDELLTEEDNNLEPIDVTEIEEIDEILKEQSDTEINEKELLDIDELLEEESIINEEITELNQINELEELTEEVIEDVSESEKEVVEKLSNEELIESTEEIVPDITEDAPVIEAEVINEDEEPDESFDIKYIHYKKERGYCIEKVIDGKMEFFGVFPTVDEAIAARDYFRDNNWDLSKKNHFKKENEKKYIYKNKKGYYEIRKNINSKTVTFGRYYKFEDAKTVRDHLENNGWNKKELSEFKHLQVNERKKNPKRYISKEKSGRYRISKRIGDKSVSFGLYEHFEDAKNARDYFEEHDWNVEDREKFKDKEFKFGKDNPQRYIHKSHNTYQIYKNSVYFGRFDTLDEAMEARDWLEEHDFGIEFKDKFRQERKKAKVSENYFENMELF